MSTYPIVRFEEEMKQRDLLPHAAAADPILDRPAAIRNKADTDRLLRLLDELDREEGL
jgi:hypothetical protein